MRGVVASLLVVAGVVVPTLSSPAARVAGGDLDTGFDGDGKVTTTASLFRMEEARANDVALQPDGKIVAAGVRRNGAGEEPDFALARYLPDGALDVTFGAGGVVRTSFRADSSAHGVAVQPDGRIVAAGAAGSAVPGCGCTVVALARYLPTGARDPTFGTGGLARLASLQGGDDVAHAVVLQPDGRIVVAGSSARAGDDRFVVARLNPDGRLDASFGTAGVVIRSVGDGGDGDSAAYGVALQPDGRIVAAGRSYNHNMGLLRLNSDGTADTTFSGDGELDVAFSQSSVARAVAIQPDGRIVPAGCVCDTAGADMAVARVSATGALDPTFGTAGRVTTAFGGRDSANDVLVQPDGRIVAVGSTGGFSLAGDLALPPESRFALTRYTPGGVLDTTFGDDGRVTTDVGAGGDAALAAARQPDGRIVAAGASGASFGLARYLADAPVPTLSVADVAVTEGDTGSSTAVVTVTLSAPATDPVSVSYSTADGTAAAPVDYGPRSGRLVFAVGQSVATVGVPIRADTVAEPAETVGFVLSNPVGATISRAAAIVAINDDDEAILAVGASVGDAVVVEGDEGTVDAVFTVTITPPVESASARVFYATSDGTATAPADYEATSGSVTFAAGESTKTFTVKVKGDRLDEITERFNVNLSNPVGVEIDDARGFGKISDDEGLVIDNLAGGPGLIDRVVVRGGAAGARLSRLCRDPRQAPCLDLAALGAGTGTNPRTEQGVTFEAIEATGKSSPSTAVGSGGLLVPAGLEIRLARAVPAVEVTLAQGGAATATVEGFLTDGTSVGTLSRSAGAGASETLRLPRIPALGVAQQPFGLATAGGDLVVADPANHLVRVLPTGPGPAGCPCESVLAGNGALGGTDEGADPLLTQVSGPYAVAVRPLPGGQYETLVADTYGHRVLRVAPQNVGSPPAPGAVVTTVAGTGAFGFSGDGGPGDGARLNSPSGVAVDATRNLVYVADTLNNRVRVVQPDGRIVTLVGDGTAGFTGDNGPGAAARLNAPRGLAVDGAGNLFIADTFNHVVRRLDAVNRTITTVVGSGTAGFSGDGGPPAAARLDSPAGVAVDAEGALLVADTANNRIRRLPPGGTVLATLAGSGAAGFGGDGGPPAAAALNAPFGVAAGAGGAVFVADTANNRIRQIAGGVITTLAGNGTPSYAGSGVPAGLAQLAGTSSTATWRATAKIDPAVPMRTYIADPFTHSVRMVDETGTIVTLAGNGMPGRGGDGGPAAAAQLDHPFGLAIDGFSPPRAVYVADTLNNVVRRIDLVAGTIATVAGGGTGGDGGPALGAALTFPTGVAVDVNGNLYVADAYASRVRKVDPGGVISTVAGTGVLGAGGDGGPGASAELFIPTGVAVDGANPPTLRVADSFNHRIRSLSPTGVITTEAGAGLAGPGGDGGPIGVGSFDRPFGVGLDSGPSPNRYVADTGNHRIRRLEGLVDLLSTFVARGAPGHQGDLGPAAAALVSSARGIGPVIRDKLLMLADSFSFRARRLAIPLTRAAPDPVRFRVPDSTIGCTTDCPEQVVTVTNTGLAANAIRSATLTGPAAGDFRVVADRCTRAVLAPGASCTFTVVFVPTASCPSTQPCRLAFVTLTGNAADSTRDVDLEGSVVRILPVAMRTVSDPFGINEPGVSARDVAFVAPPPGQPLPTGTVTFFLCRPAGETGYGSVQDQITSAGCTAGGIQVGGPQPLTVGAGGIPTASSPTTASLGISTTDIGLYCWRAVYSGSPRYARVIHTNRESAQNPGGPSPECFEIQLSTPPTTDSGYGGPG